MAHRRHIIARDGLPARDNGEWAVEKLAFLDFFGPVAIDATERKRERHYVDLYAGPGLNVQRGGTTEFDGSPLRALQLHGLKHPTLHFTDAWFVNLDSKDHGALGERIRRRVESGRSLIQDARIRSIKGDANEQCRQILEAIHPKSYVLVFADIEAPKQCAWSTIEALRLYRRHESVDLYVLFPLDMGLRRLVSKNEQTVRECAATLDRFYGDDRWRQLIPLRSIGSDASSQTLSRELLRLYLDRLREHWEHVDIVADVRRGTNHRLYKMLFASDDEAGKKIARWAKRRAQKQEQLDFGES
jgi:three-Cys-motif partner protein